jgi:hypothetical protein
MGSGSPPLSCGVFLPPPLLKAFLLLVAGWVPPLLPSLAACLFTVPAFSGSLFIYSSMRDFPSPLFGAQGTSPSLLCVFFVVVYYSVSLFSLSVSQFVQGAMLIWPRVVWLTLWSMSSQAVSALVSGGPGALLVSPFNVKWRCSAWAGVVEESKFCLFLVVFPVRCISSFSPRFYFRKHDFCFLPLFTILESPPLVKFLTVLCWYFAEVQHK